jgi:ABC-type sulfate/molybdate transport systems ATPase subunit
MSESDPMSTVPLRAGQTQVDGGVGHRALLSSTGLTVARGARTVLHDVDLQLRGGELVALLGPNGAGKSTLLDALSGALTPKTGTIERNGSVAIALQSAEMARRSVLANLTAALGWWGVPRPERAQRAREALEAIGAGHLARRPATALSGGERRRVHLARVLAVRPDVLLLDEPFAGLDPEVRAALLQDAERALRSPQRATLVVVHDRAEAWALADRLLILIEGRIVADGSPATLLSTPPSALVARFLGYDGELRDGDELLLTRAAHVTLRADGRHVATVTRVIPLEDGVRLELSLATGRLYAIAELPAPRVGDTVRIDVDGGARFAA